MQEFPKAAIDRSKKLLKLAGGLIAFTSIDQPYISKNGRRRVVRLLDV